MGSTKVKALVIGGRDFKEKDKLVELFTLEEGKITVSMKGVRGDKAKMKFAKEVFCFGEYVLENTKGMNIVSQVEIVDNFFGLTSDIDKFYEASAIVDIVRKTLGVQANPQLFIETIKALKCLCYDKVKNLYVIDKFLINIFKAMGYSFLTSGCSSCSAKLGDIRYFNLGVGEIVCPSCKNGTCISISPACFSAMKILDQTDYEKLSTIRLAPSSEVETYHLLEKNFEWRTGERFISALIS